MVAVTRISADDFLAQPETNHLVQLLEGEVIETSPSDLHQALVGALYLALNLAFPSGTYRLAPTGVRLDDHNVVEPDIFWVSPENTACQVVDGRYWHGAPDLVIEILSPSTTRHDRDTKYRLYEQYGVREYWIVEPDAALIEVYRLVSGRFERAGFYGKGETLTTPTLNDAPLNMDAVFV
jgi:Uma2 family endonuclease